MHHICRYVLVPSDGAYGNNSTGSWTGVVGMAKRGEIDIGIADFTETRNRKEIVDFAYPLIHGRLEFSKKNLSY